MWEAQNNSILGRKATIPKKGEGEALGWGWMHWREGSQDVFIKKE